MAEFTGSHEIPAFDIITAIVMIEQCEPELTVVTYWEGSPVPKGGYLLSNPWHRLPDPPTHHTTCLQCLLRSSTRFVAGDGRGELLQQIKQGFIQIESVGPRSDTWLCPRCQAHLIPRPAKPFKPKR